MLPQELSHIDLIFGVAAPHLLSVFISFLYFIITCNAASNSDTVGTQASFRVVFSRIFFKNEEKGSILSVTNHKSLFFLLHSPFFPSMNHRSCPQPPHPHCSHLLILSCPCPLVLCYLSRQGLCKTGCKSFCFLQIQSDGGEDFHVRGSSWKLKCICCKQLSSPNFYHCKHAG